MAQNYENHEIGKLEGEIESIASKIQESYDLFEHGEQVRNDLKIEDEKLKELLAQGEDKYVLDNNNIKKPNESDYYKDYWKKHKKSNSLDRPTEPTKPNVQPHFPIIALLQILLALLLLGVAVAIIVGCVLLYANEKTILASILICTGIVPFAVGGLGYLLVKIVGSFIDELSYYKRTLSKYKGYVKDKKQYPKLVEKWEKEYNESAKYWRPKYKEAYKKWEEEDLRLKQVYNDLINSVKEKINELEINLIRELNISKQEKSFYGYDGPKELNEVFKEIRSLRYGVLDCFDSSSLYEKAMRASEFTFEKYDMKLEAIKVMRAWVDNKKYSSFIKEFGEGMLELYTDGKMSIFEKMRRFCWDIRYCDNKIMEVVNGMKDVESDWEWHMKY